MTTLEIIAYIAALVLFPFVVQLATIPLLLLVDLLERHTERKSDDRMDKR